MSKFIQEDRLIFYGDMYCGFKAVACSYEITFTEPQDRKLRALCNAIGAIDRIYDNCDNPQTRQEMASLIAGSLRGTLSERAESRLEAQAYHFWLERLRRSLSPEECLAISAIVEELFRLFEADRTLAKSGDLARSLSAQGALTSRLILTATLGANPTPYSRFMIALGAFTNVLDSIWDAEADHQSGQIVIAPDVFHYFALWKEAASILPSLITIRMLHPVAVVKFWRSLSSNLKTLN